MTKQIVMVSMVFGGTLVAPAHAQIPDQFTNLRLLAMDIDKGQLVGTMRDWASGLGVRCTHCHVGPDNLQGMDFATDDKATKQTARKMLLMVRSLNRELLDDLPTVDKGERAQVVKCFTCHRGQTKPPRNVRAILSESHSKGGSEAAIAKYRSLREQHYAQGHYDLSARALNSLAQELAAQGERDAAEEILAANLELHPDSGDVHAAIGLVRLQKGELERATASFRRALQADPENSMARWGLARLEATAASDE